MRKLIAIAAATILIAGCREAAETAPEKDAQSAATDNAATPANANAAAPAPARNAVLGPAVDAEQAKKLMHDRHEGMEEIGDSMKRVSRELKGDSPDLAAVRTGAGTMARLAPQVSDWFPPGTGPEIGKTEAKAAIWENPQDFADKTAAFQQAAAGFNAAAQGSDLAAIRAAHGNLGKSCKACHDLYREEQ